MPQDKVLPRWVTPLFVVVLAALGGTAGVLAGRAWTGGTAGDLPVSADIGRLAPALELTGIDGERHRLADYAGQPVLINFWATWCPPCVRELPMLQDLHNRRDGGGLTVIAIAQEDDPELVKQFLTEHGLDMPVWLDPPSQDDHSASLGNDRSVLPYSLLIGADGRILKRRAGEFREAELREWVKASKGG